MWAVLDKMRRECAGYATATCLLRRAQTPCRKTGAANSDGYKARVRASGWLLFLQTSLL
jgi:hypothetical protein